MNGDGYDDVIVGAPNYADPLSGMGRAFVYEGSASGLSFTPVWTVGSHQVFSDFGFSVGTAGDVNGDGFDDVIVGALYYTHGEMEEGASFLFVGSACGLNGIHASAVEEGNQAEARFGVSVATAGDVNGDGFDDVIVGADMYDHGRTDEGAAFARYGRPPRDGADADVTTSAGC